MASQFLHLLEGPSNCYRIHDNSAPAEGGRDAAGGDTTTVTPGARRVLVVENDQDQAGPLVRDLRRHGDAASAVRTGEEALRSYHATDLILLDLELPDLDGLEVCRSIRSRCDVPIIAVTARGSELDRVLGLQAGADDYLVKPYGFRELRARMDAVLRRTQPQRPPHDAWPGRFIEHGALKIDIHTREVRVGERQISLTRKEFDLLHILARQPGAVVLRKRLMTEVWGGSWSRRTIDTHVSSLRNKLGASSWVITVRGVGFALGHA